MLRLLLVIPAYRESERLPPFLEALGRAVRDHLPGSAVLVVDDGSGNHEQSRTLTLVQQLRGQYPCILPPILLPHNRGKGGAILAGWDSGTDFDALGFVDADGAVPPGEIIKLAKLLNTSTCPGAIFASRIRMLGFNVERTWQRHLSGRIFAFIIGIIIEKNVYDSQCGLKFIPVKYYRKIRNKLKGMGFAFDVELLWALKSTGCTINEVPINWFDIPGSKVSFLRDTVRMILAVLEIKKRK